METILPSGGRGQGLTRAAPVPARTSPGPSEFASSAAARAPSRDPAAGGPPIEESLPPAVPDIGAARRYLKELGLLGVVNLVAAQKGILLLPVLTKFLSVREYGVWVQLSITLSLLTPIVLLGVPAALVRYLPGEDDIREIREAIWSSVGLAGGASLLIGLGLILFSSPVGALLHSPTTYIVVLAVTLGFECVNQVLITVVRAFREMNTYNLLLGVSNATEVVLVAGSLVFGRGLLMALLAALAARILSFLVLAGLVVRRYGFLLPRFRHARLYLGFGIPTVVGGIAYWTVQSSDQYLIGAFLGVEWVGYSAPGYALGNGLTFLTMPFLLLLPVVLARLARQKATHEIAGYLKVSLGYFLLLSIPAAAGVSILSDELLRILTTSEIAQHGAVVTPFVAASAVLYGVYTIMVQLLFLSGETRVVAAVWILAALVNLGLNFFVIPWLGIIGAAATTLVASLVAVGSTLIYLRKELRGVWDLWWILRSAIATALMSLFLLWLDPSGAAALGGAILASIVLYFLAVRLLVLGGRLAMRVA